MHIPPFPGNPTPSQRRALAEANGERTGLLDAIGSIVLCLVVALTIALRGC
jgi:hypothetical protein